MPEHWMKAADLAETELLQAIRLYDNGIGASVWHIADAMPEIPLKVITAKLRKMAQRKRVRGCWCGCRGDWTIVDA